jgi:hypothetical protein
MSYFRKTQLLVSVFLIAIGAAIFLAWQNTAGSLSYADLRTVLTTTTAAFGTLLGIITAGLMFTQGRFSEVASELGEKSSDYLVRTLSLEKLQSIGTHLLALRKEFTELEAVTTVLEEKGFYGEIAEKASIMLIDFVILSNLKLGQQGLPETALLVSEMDSQLYREYQAKRRSIKKEWQVLSLIKQIVDVWESPFSFSSTEPERRTPLRTNLKKALSILELKARINRNSKNIRIEVAKSLDELSGGIGDISKQVHEDRVPQLLSQMKQASAIRGKYFYLALLFIAVPLLINLSVLPQLSETTVGFLRPIILTTSLLSVMGVAFWLLYIHKILNV